MAKRWVIGRCGNCGGDVLAAERIGGLYGALIPARARCENCGATPKPMEMAERRAADRRQEADRG